jgi:chemotaxis protein methyltransferase CheR
MSDTGHAWSLVVDFMRRRCGLQLRDDQQYLLSSRLTPVARDLGYASILRFVSETTAPNASTHAVQRLLDAMTTHETSFFRDPPFWWTLERQVLPALFARTGPRPLRIWSAACSTGQEAYSLLMLIAERWPRILDGTQIVASDVSDAVVIRARAAAYGVNEANRGLTPGRLVAHFEPTSEGFRVRARLRERTACMTHNLIGRAPYPGGFDLVLARNVLIYFAEADRAAVLGRLMQSASPGGFIGIGATELVPGLPGVGAGWYAANPPAPTTSSSCAKCRTGFQVCPEHAGR